MVVVVVVVGFVGSAEEMTEETCEEEVRGGVRRWIGESVRREGQQGLLLVLVLVFVPDMGQGSHEGEVRIGKSKHEFYVLVVEGCEEVAWFGVSLFFAGKDDVGQGELGLLVHTVVGRCRWGVRVGLLLASGRGNLWLRGGGGPFVLRIAVSQSG